MKRHFFFLFLGVAAAGMAFGQSAGWRWQNPLPKGHDLTSICGVGNGHFISVGSRGTILRGATTGGHPQVIDGGTTQNLRSAFFADSLKGWAVGENGTILSSLDGGHEWQPLSSGTSYHLNRVFFLDTLVGWIAGEHGTLRKTTNGGQTWQPISLPNNNNVLSVSFYNEQIGLVGTQYGWLWKTTNGGQSWEVLGTPTGSNWKLDIQVFSSESYAVLAGNGEFIRTSNGGQTWSLKLISVSGKAMHFSDSLHGWIVGTGGKILATLDGGLTWEDQISNTYQVLNSMYFDGNQKGFIASDVGNILSTTNGGNAWASLTNYTNADLKDVKFFNRQTGCALGRAGTILRTTNGGALWYAVASGNSDDLGNMHFSNGGKGWAVGQFGRILTSNDYGGTWTSQTFTTNFWKDVHAIDSNLVWITGGPNHVLKSGDGGQTWSTIMAGQNTYPASLHFTDENRGWLVGKNGAIYHSTDGGLSWQPQASGITTNLINVFFIDSLNGWASGESGKILYTANGGMNWVEQNSGSTSTIPKLFFQNSLAGWAISADGLLLSTTNGGVTWTSGKIDISTKSTLASFSMPDTGHVWVVGSYGIILARGEADLPQPTLSEYTITGRTFKKAPTNCDTTFNPVPNAILKALPGPFYARSNSLGKYQLKLPVQDTPVSYSLRPLPHFGPSLVFTTDCPPEGERWVQVDTIPDTLSNQNFGITPSPCHYLDVDMASIMMKRRCFKDRTRVVYVNRGGQPAPESYVLVEYPEWIRPKTASIPHIEVNDRVWKFNLGTVPPGMGGSFTIIDSVLCGPPIQLMRLTQCTKASIFPISDCPPPAGWNGATLAISGTCSNGQVQMAIRNEGTGHMSDSTHFTLYMDSLEVKSGKVKLLSGDSVKLVVNAGGKTVTVLANQPLNHPFEAFTSATIENCGSSTGNQIHTSVNHFAVSPNPRSKTRCQPIVSSFDPNDKQALPIGFTSNHVVKPGTEMEYLVRFQNTGNDTAFTVYVIDSLDNNLNVESLEIGAVSHAYELTLQTTRQGRSFLRFQFDHILLPDSNTDELQSHGFLQYRIKPKDGLSPGSQVRNEAAIYFDFNPPVITSQTLTTFDNLVFTNPGLSDSVQVVLPTETRKSLIQMGLEVYPNPFTHTLHVSSSMEKTVQVSVQDLLGKEWLSTRFTGTKELELGHLPPGVYLLHFPGLNRVVKVVKP